MSAKSSAPGVRGVTRLTQVGRQTPTSLEQMAERLERETKFSSLAAVNRVRRQLFGILPEDARNNNECRGRRSASGPTKA